ncbi:MAG: Mur ligase family protein [Geminicoccaceae bacterium]
MRHKLRHLRSPLGRIRLRKQAVARLVPLLAGAAIAHRATAGRWTRIVAVVGSLGKTTTTRAVRAVLGDPRPAPDANMIETVAGQVLRCWPWRRHAAIEAGISRPGHMARLAGVLRPDIVVVTAVASEHRTSLGPLDRIRDEKAIMLTRLRPGGIAVLNGDDPRVMTMAAMTPARFVTFGYGEGCDVRALRHRLDWPHGSELVVAVGGRELTLRTRLLGRALSYPLLAALAVAWVEGRDLDRAVAALEALPPTPQRLALSRLPNDAWLIDDSLKGTLETFDTALDLLAEVPARRIAVMGDASEIGSGGGPVYRRLGERLAGIADLVLVLGNNHQPYAAGAVRAGMRREAVVRLKDDLGAAVVQARATLRPGDVVLVKGRMSQKLERVALALSGRTVGCRLASCDISSPPCSLCPMLERGWQESPEG